MNAPVAQRLFLRAVIPRLRITASHALLNPGEEDALCLGPRLCWAARLAEFEWIEVFNFTRGLRCAAHIRFGPEGEVTMTARSHPTMQPGDALKICAYAWLPERDVEKHEATLVSVDENNTVIEFRRVPARGVSLDPMSFPPPPAAEIVTVMPAWAVMAEAMD